MLDSPLILGGVYLVTAFGFSWAYYFAWLKNSDAFIVHQEMNLRPLAIWKALGARLRGQTVLPAKQPEAAAIDEVYTKYSVLAGEESTLQAELDAVTPQLEQASKEVARLGALHNQELADNMKRILKEQREQLEARIGRILGDLEQSLRREPDQIHAASVAADEAIRAEAAIPPLSVEDILARANTTSYLTGLDAASASERTLSAKRIELTTKLVINRSSQRELLETWEHGRRDRLKYFDFLYFSMGVATSNTFGDLIPNDRVVRFVIIMQLLLSLTLVGLFLNSLQRDRTRPNLGLQPTASIGIMSRRG